MSEDGAIRQNKTLQKIQSYKKRKAIVALLSERTIQGAAKKCRISRDTLNRWLNDTEFMSALHDAENELADGTIRQLLALKDSAVKTLELLIISGTAGVRLRASQTVLKYISEWRIMRDIETRLDEIEAILRSKNI